MSHPTGPPPRSSLRVVPILVGLLLVALVIALALLIERATDGGDATTAPVGTVSSG
jgi:hypothetical protein